MCLSECVREYTDLSSLLQPRLFPAKSKVGGGCISTSLHNRERRGGGGGRGAGEGWRSHFLQRDRKELGCINTETRA